MQDFNRIDSIRGARVRSDACYTIYDFFLTWKNSKCNFMCWHTYMNVKNFFVKLCVKSTIMYKPVIDTEIHNTSVLSPVYESPQMLISSIFKYFCMSTDFEWAQLWSWVQLLFFLLVCLVGAQQPEPAVFPIVQPHVRWCGWPDFHWETFFQIKGFCETPIYFPLEGQN